MCVAGDILEISGRSTGRVLWSRMMYLNTVDVGVSGYLDVGREREESSEGRNKVEKS